MTIPIKLTIDEERKRVGFDPVVFRIPIDRDSGNVTDRTVEWTVETMAGGAPAGEVLLQFVESPYSADRSRRTPVREGSTLGLGAGQTTLRAAVDPNMVGVPVATVDNPVSPGDFDPPQALDPPQPSATDPADQRASFAYVVVLDGVVADCFVGRPPDSDDPTLGTQVILGGGEKPGRPGG